jgi:hypothetical protein
MKNIPMASTAPEGSQIASRLPGAYFHDAWTIQAAEPSVAASDYQVGDRVGIFTLISNSANEVLLGDSDKHLNVVVSVHKQADSAHQGVTVTVTTVVHVHNWLGRLYMLPVTPAHKVIARSIVRAIGNEKLQ